MITGKQVLDWCGQNIWALVIALSAIIQIAPIKLNPWSSLFKWIGSKINEDLNKKVDKLTEDVNDLSSQRKEDEKDRIRWEVLDFADSCRNGQKHTKDKFHHVIALNDKYQKLLQETNDKNGVFEADYEYIQTLYKERQEKNDFL